MSLTTRRLDLRFDEDPARPDYPVVTILVDGENPLAGPQSGGFIGFDPAEILGPDAPLLPTVPGRRVALYRCSCGEAGCGCVAPVIRERDGRIFWTDFRDFTGVYTSPTVEQDPGGGKALRLPDLAFEAFQYRAEVNRATLDRSWETGPRTTARLLAEYLEEEKKGLSDLGYRRGWVAPGQAPGTFEVSLWDSNDQQVVVSFTPAASTPADRAGEMAEILLRRPPEEWRVTFRNGRWVP